MKSNAILRHFLVIAGSSLLAVSSASAQLTWDADTGTTGAQDGGGTWQNGSPGWWNSTTTTNVNWTNSSTAGAVFGAGTDGTYAVAVGGAITSGNITFNNSGYTLSTLSNPDPDEAQTITSGNIIIASEKSATIGANVTLSKSSGNLDLTGGGTLTVKTGGKIQGAAAGVFGTGTSPGTRGNLVVDGGTAQFATILVPGNAGSNTVSSLTLASGGSITVTGTDTTSGLRFGSTTVNSGGGTFHLDGGTLTVARIYEGRTNGTNTSTFNFNGGTLKAQTGSPSLTAFMVVDTANVRNDGAIIDTNSQDVTIAQNLLHSAIDGDDAIDGGLTKIGAGTLTLTGTNNTYTGGTTITEGTLKLGANGVLPGGSAVSIGTATLDADTRTDTAGSLDITGSAVINLGSGAALTFADSSEGGTGTWAGTLNITGTLGATSLQFGTSSSGLSTAQLAKISVNNSGLGAYTLDPSGYLILGGPDTTPPTLVSIVDDKSGGPVTVNTPVTYTVTFSEDIATTLTTGDFDNEGTALYTIDSVAETTPTSGVFTVVATPTGTGTLKLRIPTGTLVEDTSGNDLVVPVSDDTTITVNPSDPYLAWAGPGVLFDADANDDGVSNGLAFLLGASGPNVSALDKLPVPTQSAGALVLTFQMLDDTANGNATLAIEYSNSLAVGSWTAVQVPYSGGTVDDIGFNITGTGPLNVTATIPLSKAAGGKLFGRLKAVNP